MCSHPAITDAARSVNRRGDAMTMYDERATQPSLARLGAVAAPAGGQIARGGVGESTVQAPPRERQSEQYSLAKIVGIWAAAALPMAALAWVVAPWLAGRLDGPVALARALLVSLTAGLIWQFVLVLLLVHRERGSLRWPVLKDALWLQAPRSPRTGRAGGRLWLV